MEPQATKDSKVHRAYYTERYVVTCPRCDARRYLDQKPSQHLVLQCANDACGVMMRAVPRSEWINPSHEAAATRRMKP